ncbi:hypothetical protein [uncultured Shimia sp.]|uniref:hypothetical protein n=1 Tax=uncultured Shimia sp. TaxID=573152 RepID=UPI0026317D12|nr:hypothetical protein [uncultured Shimia sp.]
MTNPFKDTGTNPYDLPGGPSATRSANSDGMIGIGGGVGIKGDQIVTMDAAAGTVNPAGQALLRFILGRVDQREAAMAEVIGKLIAKHIQPYERRIDELEKALDQARSDVSDAIRTSVVGYLDDAPTLDELDKMAKRHKKTMEQNQ